MAYARYGESNYDTADSDTMAETIAELSFHDGGRITVDTLYCNMIE